MDNLPVQPIQPNQPQATSKKRLILSFFVILILLSILFLLNFFNIFSLSRLSPFFTFLPTKTQKPTPPPQSTTQQIKTAKMIAKVDEIIDLIKNPDPTQAAELGESLKYENQIIISGPIDPKNPKPYQPLSLMGVKEAIEEGNNSLAQERIKELILSNNLKASGFFELGEEGRVVWQKTEIDQYDPQRRILKANVFPHSKFREEVIIALFNLFYKLI